MLALQLVRPGGRIVYIGLHEETSPLAANYLVRQEVTIQGSYSYTPADFAKAIKLLWRGVRRLPPPGLRSVRSSSARLRLQGLSTALFRSPKSSCDRSQPLAARRPTA